MRRMKRALTTRQSLFVEEYLKDQNATQAWIRAGGAPKSADVNGCRTLGLASVRAAVDSRIEKVAQKCELTAEKVLAMIIEDRDLAQASNQLGAAMKGDELIGKYLGMFREKVELSGSVAVDVTLAQISEIARGK